MSICRADRLRLAPSAARIGISFCLAVARARVQFETFARAMRRRNQTAASMIASGRCTSPTTHSRIGVFDGVARVGKRYCFSRSTATRFISTAPGLGSPLSQSSHDVNPSWLSRVFEIAHESVSSASTYAAIPAKSTVAARPRSRNSGCPVSSCRELRHLGRSAAAQQVSLITATGGPPVRSSAGSDPRPSRGWTRSVGQYPAEAIMPPESRSGWPASVRLKIAIPSRS